MSRNPSPFTPQDKLNRMNPAAAEVGLGNIVNDLITQHNALLAASNSVVLQSAGLVIKAGGSAVVKAGSPVLAMVGGVPVRKAANTDMAALAGTLATAKSALWAFYIDASGNLSVSTKTADANTHDAALALMPAVPAGKAQIGFVVIDNATGSNFVGGTTALDTASLTVTYYHTVGPVIVGSAVASVADLSTR